MFEKYNVKNEKSFLNRKLGFHIKNYNVKKSENFFKGAISLHL